MKKLFAACMAVFLIAGFACTGGSKKPLMGIVTPAADHGFTGESIRHGEAEAKALAEANGWDYRYLTAGESGEQNNAVDTLIALKPQVIVLWPLTGDELRSAAQKVVDANIPLIIYDRFIENFSGQAADISGDNVGIGEAMGAYFANYFSGVSGTVNYLEFLGDSSTVPKERSDGFASTAGSKFNKVQSFVTNWSQQTAMEQLETFLNTASRAEIESLQAIYTDDDEEVMGIVSALKNYSGPATINIKLVSGVGGRRENMDLFENSGLSGIDFVTYTFSPSFIREAIKLGADVIQGKSINAPAGPRGAPYVKIPFAEIDKSNYQEYMQSEQYLTRYSI
ncbi:MAG: substrate-binding domain-containing protein [Spirochaetaceae bacterium]|jgi:ribose transport system substrate-binding protein|nr:substrate-binding domain-containing protein [Spirochaetaceae bacterium]